jgi:hypothetical protein
MSSAISEHIILSTLALIGGCYSSKIPFFHISNEKLRYFDITISKKSASCKKRLLYSHSGRVSGARLG